VVDSRYKMTSLGQTERRYRGNSMFDRVKKAAVKVHGSALGHRHLSMVIYQDKCMRQALHKVGTVKFELSKAILAWVGLQSNPALCELAALNAELDRMWIKAQDEQNEQYAQHRTSFKEILKGAKLIDEKIRTVDGLARRITRLKKQIEAAVKKQDTQKETTLQEELTQEESRYTSSNTDLDYYKDQHEKFKFLKFQAACQLQRDSGVVLQSKCSHICEAREKLLEACPRSTFNKSHIAFQDLQQFRSAGHLVLNNLSTVLDIPRTNADPDQDMTTMMMRSYSIDGSLSDDEAAYPPFLNSSPDNFGNMTAEEEDSMDNNSYRRSYSVDYVHENVQKGHKTFKHRLSKMTNKRTSVNGLPRNLSTKFEVSSADTSQKLGSSPNLNESDSNILTEQTDECSRVNQDHSSTKYSDSKPPIGSLKNRSTHSVDQDQRIHHSSTTDSDTESAIDHSHMQNGNADNEPDQRCNVQATSDQRCSVQDVHDQESDQCELRYGCKISLDEHTPSHTRTTDTDLFSNCVKYVHQIISSNNNLDDSTHEQCPEKADTANSFDTISANDYDSNNSNEISSDGVNVQPGPDSESTATEYACSETIYENHILTNCIHEVTANFINSGPKMCEENAMTPEGSPDSDSAFEIPHQTVSFINNGDTTSVENDDMTADQDSDSVFDIPPPTGYEDSLRSTPVEHQDNIQKPVVVVCYSSSEYQV